MPNSILTFFKLTGISGFPATDSKTQKIEKILLVQILDSDPLRVAIPTVLFSSCIDLDKLFNFSELSFFVHKEGQRFCRVYTKMR